MSRSRGSRAGTRLVHRKDGRLRNPRGWRAAARLVALTLALLAAACTAGPGPAGPSVPFVATPEDVGAAMLRLAGVTAADTVYDLGSGDGRLVIAAARLGARAVGIEIDGRLVQDSREAAARAGVAERAAFVWGDLFAADLRPATAVLMYLLPEVNLRLRPTLLAELRPGTPIVSHRFAMGDWRPDDTRPVRTAEGAHPIYLWIVPAPVDGRWALRLRSAGGAEEAATLEIVQRYQDLTGTLSLSPPRGVWPVTGRVRGEALALTARGEAGGTPASLELNGTVTGDRIAGTALGPVPAGAAPRTWTAERAPR